VVGSGLRGAQVDQTIQNKASAASIATPKACLAMIIKNEGSILPRLFQSVQGFVSEYCIVDTGSTDDTLDVLKSIKMPGLIVEEPFVNFATTRNFMLETCWAKTDCDYLVLLDADMVLKVSSEWDWRKLDNKAVYDMVQVSGLEYHNVRMLRRTTSNAVKVVGSTHEYYNVPRGYSHKLLPKRLVYIDDVGDGNAKSDKFERDERLLRAEVAQDPNNARAVFYLANTLKDQGKYAEAIPFYERRATMGGWHAEADYSLFMLSTCYLGLNDVAKGRQYAEQAAYREGHYERAEPLYYLAYHLHQKQEYKLAWCYATRASRITKPDTSKALFIELAIYDYWIDYERASLCRHLVGLKLKEMTTDTASKLELDRYCGQLAHDFLSKNKHAPDSLREHLRVELLIGRGEEADGVLETGGLALRFGDVRMGAMEDSLFAECSNEIDNV
jgi:glycosyltransferase involved in cell wall biosynthesis